MHDGRVAVARQHGVLACRPVPRLRGCTVGQHARRALGCCEAARCVYEAARCGCMHDGRLAVARQHGVLAIRPVPCLRGYTVWVHARRARGCCEAARCASMQAGPSFTRPYCVGACPTGAWLLRGCTVCLRGSTVGLHVRRALGCCEAARCASMQAGPSFTRQHGGAACTTGAWLLRDCTVC
jgi:hypothetical protein